MDLFDLIKLLLRRWYVVLIVGVLTLSLSVYAQISAYQEYEANGYLLLQRPELNRANDPGALTFDPVAMTQGISLDGNASFSVSPLTGQYFSVTAADDTAQGAEDATMQVLAALEAQIAAIQDDLSIAEEERIDLRMVAPEVKIEVQGIGTFLASADVFLYDPSTRSPNPYGPDSTTGRLLQVAATGDTGRQRFAGTAGTDVTFEVSQDRRDAAALLQVVTMGPDPEAVLDAFYVAQQIMAEDLDARQARADVAPSQRLTLEVLDAPLGATDVSPPVGRAAVAIVGLGGLLALGLAVGIDTAAARRRMRLQVAEEPDAPSGSVADSTQTTSSEPPPSDETGSTNGPVRRGVDSVGVSAVINE